MAAALARRSPLAMVLLVLLAEAPMHPYRMRELIRERDKDSVVNVASRNSVYQALSRLERAGLVTARETTRSQRRPERTVYAITDAGRAQLHEWLRAMLAEPRNEYPEFPAALASLAVFGPAEVAALLQTRADALREQLSGPDPATIAAEHHLHRVFLVEEEYKRAMAEAEVAWLSTLLDDLRSGALTWEAPG
ncbi:MAG: PadR family transcriptional regulator [Actinomycetota bacterium]|nr:PadR family transcriptional regulator [Actinomycetota bacterium]